MLKTLSLTAAAALSFVAAASAADLPPRSAPADPAPYYAPASGALNWTGAYAGLNAGVDWNAFSGSAGKVWGGNVGALLGVTGGYNYQFGQAVVGVEGDWDIDSLRSKKTTAGPAFGFGKSTSTLTLRARAGYATDRVLVFLTGGYAGASISGSLNDTSLPPGGQYFSTEGWRNGFALGGGIEYAFTDHLSAKAEYLYENLTTQNVFTPPRALTAGSRDSVVRAGVNYHF
jgi:outer membrane immunogenic protein